MTNCTRRGVGPVRHAVGTVRQKHVPAPSPPYQNPPMLKRTSDSDLSTLGERHAEWTAEKTTTGRFNAWIAGVLVVMCVCMCAVLAQTPATDMSHSPGVLPSGLGDAVDHDVVKVRDATAGLKTPEAAEAAGYKRVTDCVENQPAGAMGYHFQNNALLDTTLDVNHPEVLVFEKKPDGGFKLNGVEFLVPISAWTAAEPPRIMGQPLKKAERLGIWYLHVWTWEPSPSGLFADWNPNVKCGDASSKHH